MARGGLLKWKILKHVFVVMGIFCGMEEIDDAGERGCNFWSILWKGKGYCEKWGVKKWEESPMRDGWDRDRSRCISGFGHTDVSSLLIASISSVKSVKCEEGVGFWEIWGVK